MTAKSFAYNSIDVPPIQFEQFSSAFESWVTQLVDELNELPVRYIGKVDNAGGSATVVISLKGVLETDIVFAQIESSTNAVNVQKVTPTLNTITILLSGDPGASTVLSYEVSRIPD